jgi:hypothetical protein
VQLLAAPSHGKSPLRLSQQDLRRRRSDLAECNRLAIDNRQNLVTASFVQGSVVVVADDVCVVRARIETVELAAWIWPVLVPHSQQIVEVMDIDDSVVDLAV